MGSYAEDDGAAEEEKMIKIFCENCGNYTDVTDLKYIDEEEYFQCPYCTEIVNNPHFVRTKNVKKNTRNDN